uniref:Uncharacterized protein n=1 Tax=Arundo donax TaxID=35708 RepID=A0A0A9CH32_ARUDO
MTALQLRDKGLLSMSAFILPSIHKV